MEINEEFKQACLANDAEKVYELLKNEHVNINQIDENGDSLLHNAFIQQNNVIIGLLLASPNLKLTSEQVAEIDRKSTIDGLEDLIKTINDGQIHNWDFELDKKQEHALAINLKLIRDTHNIDSYDKAIEKLTQNNIHESFAEALRARNIGLIQELLEEPHFPKDHEIVNKAFIDLIFACVSSNTQPALPESLEIIKILVADDKININAVFAGTSALHLAFEYEDMQMIQLLNETGKLDFNVRDQNGNTPLHIACRSNSTKIVKFILESNIILNSEQRNNDGHTPFYLACARGNVGIVELLQDKIEDTKNGHVYIEAAVLNKADDCSETGNKMVAELLIKNTRFDITGKNAQGYNLVHSMCKRGEVDVVKLLTKHKSFKNIVKHDIFQHIDHQDSWLHILIENAKLTTEDLFDITNNTTDISQNILYSLLNKKQESLLFVACKVGNVEAVDYLLNSFNNNFTNMVSNTIFSSLEVACVNQHVKVVGLLITSLGDISKDLFEQHIDVVAQAIPHAELKDKNAVTLLAKLKQIKASNDNEHEAITNAIKFLQARVNIFNDSSGNTKKFFDAIYDYDGDSTILDELIAEFHIDVNHLNKEGELALNEVVGLFEPEELIRFLISKGADVNKPDASGKAPLIKAIEQNNTNIIKVLLEQNPDLNLKDKEGRSALHEAISKGTLETIQLLLEQNPDLNLKDKNGRAALHEAVTNGTFEALQLLLEQNPDLNLKDNEGRSVLILFLEQNLNLKSKLFDDIIVMNLTALLDKNPDVNLQDQNGFTALHWVSMIGTLEMLKLLLDKNPDVNLQDRDGYTALHYAVRYNKQEAVKLLMTAGADINLQDISKQTPLIRAVIDNNGDMLSILLGKEVYLSKDDLSQLSSWCKKNSDINSEEPASGKTKLHYAVEQGNLGLVELLVTAGANIQAWDYKGMTPLKQAVLNNNLEILDLLLGEKLAIDIEDLTIVHSAFQEKGSLRKDSIDCASIHYFAAKGKLGIIKLLLAYQQYINAQDDQGLKPLHYAISNNKPEVVKFLMQNGADIKEHHDKQGIALHYAVKHQALDVVKLLLEDGADVNEQDSYGGTALHYAITNNALNSDGSKNKVLDVIRCLLENGADINAQNSYGTTALDYAVSSRKLEALEVLLSSDVDCNIEQCIDKLLSQTSVPVWLQHSLPQRAQDIRELYQQVQISKQQSDAAGNKEAELQGEDEHFSIEIPADLLEQFSASVQLGGDA